MQKRKEAQKNENIFHSLQDLLQGISVEIIHTKSDKMIKPFLFNLIM